MKSLLNDDIYYKKVAEFNKWMKETNKTPLPEPTPIIFPDDVTREDIYPSYSHYAGD